jgi:exo-1,4-beta-D-glucosaminidase
MERKRTSLWLVVCLAVSLLPRAFASPQSSNLAELESGWKIISAREISGDESSVSQDGFDASRWYAVQHMPATVLQVLEDDGVYKNLYQGMNLVAPGDLWKQDWWYRTTFSAPAGRDVYSLIFKGINYRADIWLNGHKIADSSQVVGMYDSFEFDVTKFIRVDAANVLAVKVTPERGLLSEDGMVVGDHPVELADSWLDWINWKYIGYHDAERKLNIPFVPDRNAGVWKRLFLSTTGPVALRNPYVATDLPLPALSPAALTVYCDLRNHSEKPVSGILHGEISRAGKSPITFEKKVTLRPSEASEVAVTPSDVAQLSVSDPELWWPYRWGKPNLYHLKVDFIAEGKTSDSQEIDFGIRKITQARDQDNTFPQIGSGGGNFYLQINGRDYLIRGAAYTPDLLFKNDPERDAAMISYVKDLGLNLIRWELKIADETMIERADREGIPVMLGWMCCMQWEHWNLWSAEDQWVARASLRARLRELRSHPSVVLWANGSDGLPPDPVLDDYHQIEKEVHWQNAIVDTVADRNRSWSGIHMEGPYVWRPPYYWFSDVYGPARGSSAEEGDNETIPPLESLKKFIPADHLWPPDDYWYFHAGGNEGGNNTLANIRRALNQRYGPTNSAEELAKKAQLAYYEDVRAQYESYATHWSNRKMVMHWMMNSPWPSFFGHLFDYYFKQGGGYFGAKKAMLPVSIVWDYYATAGRNTAHVYAVNQTAEPLQHVKVSVTFYNVDGTRKYADEAKDLEVAPYSSLTALSVARIPDLSSTYFVRCRMSEADGAVLADNTYWESTTDDDLGSTKNDVQFTTNLVKWADLSALDTMPRSEVTASTKISSETKGEGTARITLTNRSNHVAFFLRAEITKGADGEEVLPITYDDNYITLYPHETRTLVATFAISALEGRPAALRVEGYNVAKNISSPNQ